MVAAPPLPLAVEVLPELLDGRFLFFRCVLCVVCVLRAWGSVRRGVRASERGGRQVRQAAAAASTVGARRPRLLTPTTATRVRVRMCDMGQRAHAGRQRARAVAIQVQ